MVFGEMCFEAGVTEKVAMTVMTTFGGFETPWVLEKGAALDFVVVWTSMASCMVIGF